MLNLVWCLVLAARLLLATHRDLVLENLALRHRDRDGVHGKSFGRRIKDLRIKEVLTAPRSPWQGRELGRVIELPEVGGLHHRYVREAA
jgi:hypothetical protein